MQAISSAHHDVMAPLVPGGVPSLAHLSDEEVLMSTRRLVGKSNQIFAALLLHLAEVEARGIHRTRLSSLYTYCVYELRFSEDAAARRSSAARLVKQFPILFDAIADGELHLTGLLMIGPHLTPQNHVEVLGRAKFRTKKELAKLVRELNPLPHVPDLVQPLRPVPALPTTRPSWAKLVASWEPPVRELPAGQRPGEWANDAHDDPDMTTMRPGAAPARFEASPASESVTLGTVQTSMVVQSDPLPPAPLELPPITGPQQYQMQFTTSEEHVRLVERAKALVARERPDVSLAELHIEAMGLLVASLEKRKFAVTDRPRKRTTPRQHETPDARSRRVEREEGLRVEPGAQAAAAAAAAAAAGAPRQRGRYVPAAERRAVFERDGGRCTFSDACGERCRETHYLELHHLKPFAHDGENVASNLTLRCAAHNALAAEHDFGSELIEKKRSANRHESLAAQG